MNENNRNNLDIKRLLELGDLDIRSICAANNGITVDEYSSRVDNFVEIVPEMLDILQNILKLGENIKALKELEAKLGVSGRSVYLPEITKNITSLGDLQKVLTKIGYNKLNFDLEGICNAIKISNHQAATKPTAEAIAELTNLYQRTKGAYPNKRKFSMTQDSTDSDLSGSTTLKELIKTLDYQEENRKLRILAVDDVPVVLNTITSVLGPYYEVYALKNSSQVEKFLMQTTPELFLLDIEMNEVNGFDLVPLIRGMEKHKDTPIVFLTGNASYNNLRGAIQLGASDFITKPIDKNILLEKIEKNIVRKRAF